MSEIEFKIGDIIIHKKPYDGEAPYKIISEKDKHNFYKCMPLNTDNFLFDDDSVTWLAHYQELECYEKIVNFNLWLYHNKQKILTKLDRWHLERCY